MFQFQAIAQLFNKLFPVVIGAVIVFLYLQWQHAKEESKRWEQNAKSNVDYLTRGEFKDSAKAWGIKPKNVKEITRTFSNTTTIIKTDIKDSIIHDSIPVHCVNWSNGYTSLNGCFETGAKLVHKDTLDLILKRVPTKKFLFIKYRKIDSLTVQNKDPNSKYTVNRISRVR
jgi:hypothetical protein